MTKPDANQRTKAAPRATPSQRWSWNRPRFKVLLSLEFETDGYLSREWLADDGLITVIILSP